MRGGGGPETVRLGALFRREFGMCAVRCAPEGTASYRYGDGGIDELDSERGILLESVYSLHEESGRAHHSSCLRIHKGFSKKSALTWYFYLAERC